MEIRLEPNFFSRIARILVLVGVEHFMSNLPPAAMMSISRGWERSVRVVARVSAILAIFWGNFRGCGFWLFGLFGLGFLCFAGFVGFVVFGFGGFLSLFCHFFFFF